MSDPCPHETLIKQSHKELFGNGGKGLTKEFIILKTEFKEMNVHVENLATSYSALARSQIEHDAVEKLKAEGRDKMSTAFKKVGIVFSIVLGIVGTLIVILSYIG